MSCNALFVAASAKNMGKTSTCTGLVRGLQRALVQSGSSGGVGYMKPLGQKLVKVGSGRAEVEVDKDVPVFKDVLHCGGALRHMSPVLIDKDYTKRVIEGRISAREEFARIRHSFQRISQRNEFTVVEGAGHTGVGGVLGLSSPAVARKLGIPLVLVLNGGIGCTIDDFLISKQFCEAQGVAIRGVIINKIHPAKMEQVARYTGEYLEREHDTPVLGYVPDLSEFSSRCHAGKLTGDQRDRVLETADHYEKSIDFHALFDALGISAQGSGGRHFSEEEDEEELQKLYGYYAVAT